MNLIQELERFFELDLKVKKLLETSRPNTYDKDPVEIEKDLLNVLKISKNAIIQMAFLSKLDVADDFYDKLEQIKLKINNCNFNVDKLIDVYEKNILNLSKGLEESLEKNIGGYDTNEEIYVPLRFCNTVNDMLHYLHFYVLNDENVLHSMNVIESKINESDYYSVLYGKESEEARDIYNNLPNIAR